MNAPPKFRLPPDQSVVPPLSNVLDVTERVLTLFTVSVLPGGMTVQPVPFIAPPVQFMALRAVTLSDPPKAPPLKFTTAGDTGPVPSKLGKPPEMINWLFVQI